MRSKPNPLSNRPRQSKPPDTAPGNVPPAQAKRGAARTSKAMCPHKQSDVPHERSDVPAQAKRCAARAKRCAARAKRCANTTTSKRSHKRRHATSLLREEWRRGLSTAGDHVGAAGAQPEVEVSHLGFAQMARRGGSPLLQTKTNKAPNPFGFGACAKKRTRTSTSVKILAPQASASAIPPPSRGVT